MARTKKPKTPALKWEKYKHTQKGMLVETKHGHLEVYSEGTASKGVLMYTWRASTMNSAANGECDSIAQGKDYAQRAMALLVRLGKARKEAKSDGHSS